jgi:hypothetical protein
MSPDSSFVPTGEHSDEQDPQADYEHFPDDLDQDLFDLEPGEQDEDERRDRTEEGRTALPPKMDAWRRRSATGAILTGFALGLQQVFDKEKEEPAIVMQTSGDPPRDLPVEADVERARPRQSVVNIRPWLLATPGGAGATASDSTPPDPEPTASSDDGSDREDG